MRAAAAARWLAGLSLALALGGGPAARAATPVSDRALGRPAPYDPGPPRYPGVERRSSYLTMRDGVRIAIDLYLPRGLAAGERLPALLFQTRYWRSARLRWPFHRFRDPALEGVRPFVTRGYAWVSLDARGSGASFGQRPYPWSPDEVRDGAEVAGWIAAQPWSNGKVGSFGTSYDGTTAELLASTGHPAVVAVAPRFSVFDVYADIAYPGGLPLVWFTETWARFNRSLDRGEVPGHLRRVVGFWSAGMVAGVRPVDGADGRSLLRAALRDHAANGDIHALAQRTTFRDDTSAQGETLDVFSPHAHAARVEASGAAVYGWSGWFDGGYAHAAIKRHRTLRGPANKLLLGPWDHGGRHQVRGGRSEPSQFDHVAELLKFFDHHLKGRDSGLSREAPVHYYTLVEGRWKAAASWPPPADTRRYYLAAGGALAEEPPRGGETSDRYRVDERAGTGPASRWNSLMGLAVHYPDRARADRRLLVYETPPLPAELEVTGHPVATLHVASSASDGAFFAYLEDVDPQGRVRYVTEGVLRALHRKLGEGRPPHPSLVPWRRFERADARPLVPGEVAELVFDLLPTSYLFRAGHRVRLALAGADADHFARIPAEGPPTWDVHRDAAHPSHLALPVVPR